ncbi:MAG: TonB-dependent receptor [Sphingomonadales bacterium]|nr:MAG: TonB-dependent receptor [Sphingomonadales bacterium]TNF02388.1 MAG: TonB-dependent receptor [Sphingomonadales bacterium]
MRYRRSTAIAGGMLSLLPFFPAMAQESDTHADGRFRLGEILVTGQRGDEATIGSSTLSSEAIYVFDRASLDDAAQLIPGVSTAGSGNSRNERMIYVRGFDRYQVPLSIDGIRVYLPADGRLDYGRFLTADIAEIQVAKGYASVLDGPGAMGGAVNLVTRKPTRELEVEARGTLTLDNDADYAGYNVFGLIGTKHDQWYAQASYTRNFTDHWDLPNDFAPTEFENGGARDLSRSRDWRVNAKVGFTPNATDEYALSYTRQEGSKHAPLHVSDSSSTRYWDWPYWNIQNIYFLSTTQLSDMATVRTKLYYNEFKNSLDSYDDATLTTQTLRRSFNSAYDDRAYGGSVQLDLNPATTDRLSLAFHYRNDLHREYQESFAPAHEVEPWQTSREETYSAAIENSLMLSPTITFVAGFGYDWRQLRRAEDYADGAFIHYPIRNADAWNAQGALRWTPDADTSAHLSVSSRARFPTLFERFSTRFGGAVSNPGLKAERATQVEIGGTKRFGPVRAEAAIWYARVNDAIMSFPFVYEGTATSQSRNVGNGDYYGAELGLTATITPTLTLGGNYSWVKRDLDDPSITAFHPTGVPSHKAFLYARWTPLSALSITPNVDIASDRWVSTPTGAYYRTGDYVLANLRIDYTVLPGIDVGVGGRNLFDTEYSTADGYPEQGRTLFVSLRARY